MEENCEANEDDVLNFFYIDEETFRLKIDGLKTKNFYCKMMLEIVITLIIPYDPNTPEWKLLGNEWEISIVLSIEKENYETSNNIPKIKVPWAEYYYTHASNSTWKMDPPSI